MVIERIERLIVSLLKPIAFDWLLVDLEMYPMDKNNWNFFTFNRHIQTAALQFIFLALGIHFLVGAVL